MQRLSVGLDRLVDEPGLVGWLRSKRVGLLAHPASVNRSLTHISDVFEVIDIKPVRLFGPEHGYGGEAQDMIGVDDAVDPRSGAPIVSLYGDEESALVPRKEHLSDLDVLVIDLADVGARYYTFIWTALLAVRKAAELGVHCLLLDRPNPLGGTVAEGAHVEEGFASFVGLEPTPVRHGMTIGEIVCFFAERDGISLGSDGALSVLPMRGWRRTSLATAWDRPFVTTSPNMPTFETALVYPGGCLIEGTNLSEGRGTTRPFELVGAPWLDGRRLAEALNRSGLPGFFARPVTFWPQFQKHAGQVCGGVFLHVDDEAAFRPYATYLALIGFAHRHHPDAFAFRTERYEFIDHIPAIDLLTGSARAREAWAAGEDPVDVADTLAAVADGWTEQIQRAAHLVAQAARA